MRVQSPWRASSTGLSKRAPKQDDSQRKPALGPAVRGALTWHESTGCKLSCTPSLLPDSPIAATKAFAHRHGMQAARTLSRHHRLAVIRRRIRAVPTSVGHQNRRDGANGPRAYAATPTLIGKIAVTPIVGERIARRGASLRAAGPAAATLLGHRLASTGAALSVGASAPARTIRSGAARLVMDELLIVPVPFGIRIVRANARSTRAFGTGWTRCLLARARSSGSGNL